MRIMLAYPPFLHQRDFEENVAALPMGLLYLAAVCMEAGHEVRVADWHTADEEAMCREMQAFQPDILGVSVFHNNRWGGLDAAALAKSLPHAPHVVFGGVGATFLPDLLLRHFSQVDWVVRGEAETSFPALLDILQDGGDPMNVPGLTFRRQGEIVSIPEAPLIQDLDSLPDPAEHFTFQHVALSRGCPGNCRFCASPAFWGRKVRFHSPAYFVRQLKRLWERGVRFFYISDDTFTLRRNLVMEVCDRLLAELPEATWAAISRVDRVDSEMLTAMRKAGCIQLSFGLESGSPEVRERLNKGTTNQDIVRAITLTREHGILPRAYLIYGNPGEKAETIKQSIDLLDEAKPLAALFHVLTVFPGSGLYQEAKERYPDLDDAWLDRIEDLLWLDLDPELREEEVRKQGQRLKSAYFSKLSEFARSLQPANVPNLAPHWADFASRLAATFDQGDYSRRPDIPHSQETAEALYRKALDVHDEPHAFHGLGTLLFRNGKLDEAVAILARGRERFPGNPDLALCLAVARMNQGRFQEAMESLRPWSHLPEAASAIAQCRAALKN
ncbi:B12-binding domain-containing radical SAM protein [Desulfohalovibrio reitneri]|uniref:B12-binding domain-containing radical SAM protein n=1 Tax=Desulfohalovibrio reitneri TaxID=1307759 RepID=UPI0004A727B8|nr:B12-binding domain-containing radical SAM protein [Desulfohalovibrio reitneri]